MANIDDKSLKERIAELRALKSQAQADAERAVITLQSVGVEITPAKLRSFADAARQRLRGPDGRRYRRDHLRALAQRIEVAEREVRIMGSRTNLLRTLAAASGVNPATAGVPSFGPRWRRGCLSHRLDFLLNYTVIENHDEQVSPISSLVASALAPSNGTRGEHDPRREACLRAGIDPPASFHILHQTYATHLLQAGAPLPVIAANLGHSDTRMTERHYAHLVPSHVAEVNPG